MLVWNKASCFENLQIFYYRVNISEEAKFWKVWKATFRGNNETLCGIFQNVLTAPNPPQNSTAAAEEKYHKIATQQAKTKSDTKHKGIFFSFNPEYTYFLKDLMIWSSKPVKIPDIRVSFKFISGHKF